MKKLEQKRNPQDATLRNIRALKARVSRLELQVQDLTAQIAPSAVAQKVVDGMRAGKRGVDKFIDRITTRGSR